MVDPNPAANSGGSYDPEAIKAGILQELSDLKATVESFGVQAIKDGSWFNKFLKSCLSSYERQVMEQGGAAYLRGKYPGLPTDAVAGKLCELAEMYAALAGGLSGATASGAVLTAGFGVPAAIVAVMAEVFYTVRLQLRLAFDLHLVYDIPLAADDPEELTQLFAVVYGVKVAEVGGLGLKALGPEVARAQLFRLIHGNTPLIQAAASTVLGPRIAKQVTQKAIIKTAVPIVGVGISAGWNYATTGVPPAATALPAGTVTRYRPPYQFPGDSRALQGAALVPPGPLPVSQPPVGESPWGGAGPPVPNTLAPPPTQWVPAAPQAPPAGQWVAPVAIGGATAAAMQPSPAPVAPPTPPPAFSSSAPQMQPLQPLANPPTVPITRHAWRVVGVYDGDTVTCLDEAGLQQKVRLVGIDAPESSQDYGRTSREALAGMVFGRTVEVIDAGRDANGTSLGRLFVDGQDVNLQLVSTGNAWADPAATDPALAAAQTAAQSQRLGLWAQPDPTPPWNFR